MNPTATAVTPSRWDVVQSLQAGRVRALGNDETEQVFDHAIDLALSATRDDRESGRLRRDVERNAAHSVRRGRARECRRVELYAVRTMRLTTLHDDVVSDIDVAAHATAKMTAVCDCVLRHAAAHSPAAVAFVERLMDGGAVADAALNAGIPRASAYRFLSSLREPVSAIRDAEGAA